MRSSISTSARAGAQPERVHPSGDVAAPGASHSPACRGPREHHDGSTAAKGEKPRVAVVITALLLVMLLAALDQTIVATALPTIVGDLGGLNHISWVVTAYLLAQTVVTPLYGKLGDLYGRKLILQVAVVIFLIGSVLCGIAQNMPQLIAFRAIQGLGGGGLMVGAQAAIGDVVSPRERGPLHRPVRRGVRRGQRRRAPDRGLPHLEPVVALDLLHQHPARRGGPGGAGGHAAGGHRARVAVDRLHGHDPAGARTDARPCC